MFRVSYVLDCWVVFTCFQSNTAFLSSRARGVGLFLLFLYTVYFYVSKGLTFELYPDVVDTSVDFIGLVAVMLLNFDFGIGVTNTVIV